MGKERKILFDDKSWLIGLDGLGCVVKRFIGSGVRNLKEGIYFGKFRGKIFFLKNF